MEELKIIDLVDGFRVLEKRLSVALMYSGLRVNQLRILNIIDEESAITVSVLSKKLNITRASASAMVNELVQADIAYAVENESDRRSFYVKLTLSGKQKLTVARKDIAVLQKNLSENLPVTMVVSVNEFAENLRKTWKHPGQARSPYADN